MIKDEIEAVPKVSRFQVSTCMDVPIVAGLKFGNPSLLLKRPNRALVREPVANSFPADGSLDA